MTDYGLILMDTDLELTTDYLLHTLHHSGVTSAL